LPWAHDWQPLEATQEQIIGEVLRGRAIAPQFKDGQRRTANFLRAGFIAADVDAGMTLEEAKQNAFVKKWGSFIYTTPTHRADHHRFRIVFLLDEQVLNAEDFADALLGLAIELGSDKSATDAARISFGNRDAMIFQISRTMPAHVVADLIERGARSPAAGRPLDGRLLPLDSARRVEGSELIKLATGQTAKMDELGAGVSVHCPNYDDANASAFTVRSTKGARPRHPLHGLPRDLLGERRLRRLRLQRL
jgi:hypothetical protein